MEEYGVIIPQPMALQGQGSGVTAPPMYAIELPDAGKAAVDDQTKSQLAWTMFAAGCICFLLGFYIFLLFLWPFAVYIFYCQIPASERSNYPKTKTPAMLSLASCAGCSLLAVIVAINFAVRIHQAFGPQGPFLPAGTPFHRFGQPTTPRLQANFTFLGKIHCVGHEGLILEGEHTTVGSLDVCKFRCAASEQCQAIHWWNSSSDCELLSQTRIKTVNPVRIPSPLGVECWKRQLERSDRVRLFQNVVGQAHDRWQTLQSRQAHSLRRRPYPEEGGHSFQLFEDDFGTVDSVSSTGSLQVSVIFDRDVRQKVWVDLDDLVKDDPPLAEADDDELEGVLETFPQAEEIATLKCPLTEKIFIDPVVASDGRTYEKSALEKASHKSEAFVTNYAIKAVLEDLIGKDVLGVGAETAAAEATAEPESSSTEIEESRSQKRLRTVQTPSPRTTFGRVGNFECPISRDIFKQPVVASDGRTYEKSFIQMILKQVRPQSPITREGLSPVLLPDRAMKSLLSVLIIKADKIHRPTVSQRLASLVRRAKKG